MRISCSTTGLMDMPLAEALPLIRQAGCEAVELSWSHVQADFPSAPRCVSLMQQLLDESGLVLSGLRLTDLRVEDPRDWAPIVTQIREQLAFAGLLGCASVNVYAGDRKTQSIAQLASGLEQVLIAAGELGLTLHLANRLGSRIEQLEDLRQVFADVAHPALGVLVDVGQFLAAAVNPRDVLAEFQYHIGCVHLSDRIGKRPVPIGRGKVNLPGVLADLKQMHYNDWLVIDLEVSDAIDVAQVLNDAVTHVKQLLEREGEGEKDREMA